SETDGPLGALFLARALIPLGGRVEQIGTDGTALNALRAGLRACGLSQRVPVVDLNWRELLSGGLTHLLALERVGPSHADGRCYTMRGRDVTDLTAPTAEFSAPGRPDIT